MSSQYYKDNFPAVLAQLQRAGIALQEAGAEAMTMGAKLVAVRYKKSLKGKTKLRSEKFTLGSVVVLPARAFRSDKKTLRRMDDVNAIVGVKQLRGGTHYLAAMEIGGKKKGAKSAGGKIATPFITARGGNDRTPVLPKYRVTRGITQYQDKFRGMNPRQQMRALLEMARGKGASRIKQGLYQGTESIFYVQKGLVIKVRDARNSQATVKPKPLFEGAVKELTEAEVDKLWVIGAKKKIAELGK